jgi:hypothetical protein
MALPRKKVPMDSPGVIAARERMRAIDFSVVIPKDPDDSKRWHYAWVRESQFNMSSAKAKGYVNVGTSEVDTPNAFNDTEASMIKHGDVVLMKCPMHIHKARIDDAAEYKKALVQSKFEESVDVGARAGVKISRKVAKAQTYTRKTKKGYNEDDEEVILEA